MVEVLGVRLNASREIRICKDTTYHPISIRLLFFKRCGIVSLVPPVGSQEIPLALPNASHAASERAAGPTLSCRRADVDDATPTYDGLRSVARTRVEDTFAVRL